MNISDPVADTIGLVDFNFISTDEIRAISVKQIQNDTTFDNLMTPVPDGLYDGALGSWGDSACDTCHLRNVQCPGHAGHIELPVPVYHPVFMDQVLRLLRSQCQYCQGFRMARRAVHAYVCKFRLLQYGLLHEAHLIDICGDDILGLETYSGSAGEAEEEGNPSVDPVIKARDRFLREALHRQKQHRTDIQDAKHEGSTQMRRTLIKGFLADIVKIKTCASCQGISHSYRKDRFVKIFEKPLSGKDKVTMARKNMKATDVMASARKPKPKTRRVYPRDEGVADLEVDSSASDAATNSADEGDAAEGAEKDGEEVEEGEREEEEEEEESGQRYISAMEVNARLAKLFEKEQEVMGLVYNARPRGKGASRVTADMFFLRAVLVPPNRYRPEARMGADRISEAQQNTLYKNILRSCGRINQIHREIFGGNMTGEKDEGNEGQGESKRNVAHLHQAWTELQESVNCLIDKQKSSSQALSAQRAEDGIKQKLEKKEGLFRKNMMGKRVNFAARSVISPDPNIETSEIGVPPVFASKLSYPEPVTMHNVRELARAVVNGADKYPGALAIENEAGQTLNLRWKTAEEREALAHQLLTPDAGLGGAAKNKKVHRHLADGDVVLMNRQPTLHKPSIMGHRVRVLPGEKTLRMHYANCNTYNADFDGDEMNMHFPQNELARAEALHLADTDHQYLSGTQGSPLRGLIQDHLSISVALCSKDMFFNQGDYHQLVYSALRPEHSHTQQQRIQVLPPAIVKPAAVWTGKQVITTILQNITPPLGGGLWMRAGCKIKGSTWGPAGAEEESVLFQDGVFVTGILDKSQLGPSSGGLIHSIHEIYGPEVAAKLLSSLGRLLTRTLSMQAFTCGMDDLMLTPEGERLRRGELAASHQAGLEVASEYVGIQGEDQSGNEGENEGESDDGIQGKAKSKSANGSDAQLLARLEEVTRDDSKQHNLDKLMSRKAAEISTAVTKACLPNGLAKPFPRNNMQSMTTSGAKGSQVNANQISVNLGQQVLEGRRVPLMVSGKSLPCFRGYETNIRAGGYIVNRFLTGIRVPEYYFHHMAGREGLIDTAVKTSRSGYLQRCIIKGMEGLSVAYDTTVRDADGSLVQFLYGEDGLDVTKQQFLYDFEFVLRNFESQSTTLLGQGDIPTMAEKKAAVLKHMKSAVKHAKHGSARAKDPVNSLYSPCRNLFATSEKFFTSMTEYLADNTHGLVRAGKRRGDGPANMGLRRGASPPDEKLALRLLATKYMRSHVEPGEAVGIVAGQSIGEPSTQMTLNTFHLAGHSAKNVTLGIPRLREILMTAARNPSTPSMTLVVNVELPPEQGLLFAKSISKLALSHVLDSATVTESVASSRSTELARTYKIRLSFFPPPELRATYGIEAAGVVATVEKEFLPHLVHLVKKESKKRQAATPAIGIKAGAVEMATSRPGAARGHGDGDGDGDDSDGGMDDGDATSAKQRANRSAAVSYGANDDEDDLIQQRMEREASLGDKDDFEDEGYGQSPGPQRHDKGKDDSDADGQSDADMDLDDERSRRIQDQFAPVTRFRCDGLHDESRAFTVEFTLEYPADMAKLLMINVVKEAVRKSVIQQIPRLGECTYVPDENIGAGEKVAVIHTTGVNLRAMWQFPQFINPNRIITNDIAAVLDEYGVEACRNNIIQELRSVFKSHNITVDYRHLNLIADYMTRNGDFTPFNRTGLTGNISPFTKMSFETTLAFLKDALVEGDWDNLNTPSGRLVMGKLGRIGTGAFELLARTPTTYCLHP